MEFKPSKINVFLFFKLPSAYWSGVRLRELDDFSSATSVTHSWRNQNPFKSMYFAVQAMAAELATGVLVMKKISESGVKISMLVANQKASFIKKAKGRIVFQCMDGLVVDEAIHLAIESGQGQTFWMESKGYDESGAVVSVMNFEWTIKRKI